MNGLVALAVTSPGAASRFAVLPASALCGLGAAVLWTAQGVYVTRAAAAAAASNDVCQGTFFGLFSLNGVVGFALALALLPAGQQQQKTIAISHPHCGSHCEATLPAV